MPVAVDLTPLDLVTRARLEPVATVLIAGALAWYLWSVRRLRARGRPWPAGRTAAFCGALAFLALATLSGLPAYDRRDVVVVVVQHLSAGLLAPLLVALGAPVTLALAAGGPRLRALASAVSDSRAARFLTYPVVSWTLYGASVLAVYFSGLFPVAARHGWLEQLVELWLLAVGCVFFWPAVGIDPPPVRRSYVVRAVYLLLTLPYFTVLGMALQSAGSPLVARLAVQDTHIGGEILWTVGEFLGLICALGVLVEWLQTDQRRAERRDEAAEAAAEAQLAHWRATRDAAARAAGTVRHG